MPTSADAADLSAPGAQKAPTSLLDEMEQLAWAREQPVACAGYLKKSRATAFGHTKRFYQLRGHVLAYFESEAAAAAMAEKGFVSLAGAILSVVKGIARRPRGYAAQALRVQAPARELTLFPKTVRVHARGAILARARARARCAAPL